MDTQAWWWEDAANGSRSEIRTRDRNRQIVYATVWQPGKNHTWETALMARSEGLGLSLASSKVDAETALRRDAERIIEALGGKVVWP